MSLLAAFVAMLGKQWVNRYLRHTGGSVVERSGDRQRKLDGLERWPFRTFIESLSIMLQIALLLLAAGLSRYVWSVNTSVASVVISFTALGILFYIGIVVAGTSSYECPFQTPASTALQYIRDSDVVASWSRGMATKFANQIIILLLRIDRRFGNAKQGLVQGIRRFRRFSLLPTAARDAHRRPLVPRLDVRDVGRQAVILLHQVDQGFRNIKRKLVRWVQKLWRVVRLRFTAEDPDRQPPGPPSGPGLRLHVRNMEVLRRQNANNARCVCWVLRNITDPEAMDSAIRLAGIIRWFDGDSYFDPPFDLIVSTFETCFDTTHQLYPGMRDRAYLSARAILQIKTGAGLRSRECASKYPIPTVPSSSPKHGDADLDHIILMFKLGSGHDNFRLYFPKVGTNTHAHILWMSNLFVDLIRIAPNPTLESYESCFSAVLANHKPMIANTLLVWCVIFGGHLEEETYWVVDKSYVLVPLTFLSSSLLKVAYASNSLEDILSYLSTRVTKAIADGKRLHHLYYLLEYLAAWSGRPGCLTTMAYQWCFTISEAAESLVQRGIPLGRPGSLLPRFRETDSTQLQLQLELQPSPELRLLFRRQDHTHWVLSWAVEVGFSHIGPGCSPVRPGDTFTHSTLQDPTPLKYMYLLPVILEIGFRLVEPGHGNTALHSNPTPHHGWVFERAFSSDDDEVIADAVCAWVTGYRTPSGSFVTYLAERAERDTPFSPRLRRVSMGAIECIESDGLKVSGSWSGAVHLLHRLKVDVRDVGRRYKWVQLLLDVICSPGELESLSSHYWLLLDELVPTTGIFIPSEPRDVEVMRSFEEAGDWEKLEVWLPIVWRSLPWGSFPSKREIVRATLGLLLLRPSALPKFENLAEPGYYKPQEDKRNELQRICDEARQTERSPPVSPSR